MQDKIVEMVLNKLVEKHRYFHSKSGDVHEVVMEKDFKEIANNIASEISSQFTVIAEGEVKFNDEKSKWQIGEDFIDCLFSMTWAVNNRGKKGKLYWVGEK